MSSCSSFWGELVKNVNKTPALRPETKGLRPGARLSIHNVAPLDKKSNKTQLLFTPNAAHFAPKHGFVAPFHPKRRQILLSQAIDRAEVAAPLIVKTFNKIARAGLNIAAPFPGPSRSSFRSSFGPSSHPPPFQAQSSPQSGSRRSSNGIC